jgi:DnaJ-class molecular chaperone
MKDKYSCWICGGTGWNEIHSPQGHFTETCLKCGGTGRKRITISLEEYEGLKRDANAESRRVAK